MKEQVGHRLLVLEFLMRTQSPSRRFPTLAVGSVVIGGIAADDGD